MDSFRHTGDVKKTISLAKKALICIEEQPLNSYLLSVSTTFKNNFTKMVEQNKNDGSPVNDGDKSKHKQAKQTSLKNAIRKGAENALGNVDKELEYGESMFSAMAGKTIANALTQQLEESKVRHLRLSALRLKQYLAKRYDKTLSDKIYHIIEQREKNLYNIEIGPYIQVLYDLLLQSCYVEKGL